MKTPLPFSTAAPCTRVRGCLAFLAFLLISLLLFHQQLTTQLQRLGHTIQKNACPTIFDTVMVFEEHDEYQNMSHAADAIWWELLTPNGGFLMKEDGEGVVRKHGISMFHQLHCLQMIREAIQRLQNPGDKENGGEHMNERHDHSDDAHWLHCLDYLRQSILCYADDTIETPKKNTRGMEIIDGMIPHRCRNTDVLYEMSRSSGSEVVSMHSHHNGAV